MKNLINLDQINLTELSSLEQREIQGGEEVVTFRDSQGYRWYYTYNDAGTLTNISVARAQCVQ